MAIIERFAGGQPKLTKDLVAPSGLAPSTMSEHLRHLREAGLLTTRPDGPGVWYCLCRDRLDAFVEAVAALPTGAVNTTPHDASTKDQRP